MDKIKVMIVDDIENIVQHFKMIIDNESDMEVVGTANSGEDAVVLSGKLDPDIILIDIQMETDIAGIIAIEKIKQKNSKIKIIVLTIHDDDDMIFNAYSAGAMDFLIKTTSIVEIINSIRNVYRNTLHMRPEIAEIIVKELSRLKNEQNSLLYFVHIISKLTTSEFEILKLVYKGYTYRQIAKMRHVEEVTVRSQANKILGKVEQKSMKELVRNLKSLKVLESFE